MNDCLDCSYLCDVAMKDVERGELPTSGPQEDVVPSSKHPEKWEVGEGNYPSAVGEISPHLLRFAWPAKQ